MPAGKIESVKCSFLKAISCFLSYKLGQQQLHLYINKKNEISSETNLEETLCTGSPAEAETMELAITTGTLMSERGKHEDQEKLRVATAGTFPQSRFNC